MGWGVVMECLLVSEHIDEIAYLGIQEQYNMIKSDWAILIDSAERIACVGKMI